MSLCGRGLPPRNLGGAWCARVCAALRAANLGASRRPCAPTPKRNRTVTRRLRDTGSPAAMPSTFPTPSPALPLGGDPRPTIKACTVVSNRSGLPPLSPQPRSNLSPLSPPRHVLLRGLGGKGGADSVAVPPLPGLVSPTSLARRPMRERDRGRGRHFPPGARSPRAVACQADARPDNRAPAPCYLRARHGCAAQKSAPRATSHPTRATPTPRRIRQRRRRCRPD